MKLLLLNYPYLSTELKELGTQIITAGHYVGSDVILQDFTYQEISQKIDLSAVDVVIFADGLDQHPIYQGLEFFSCLTVYIAIDSTINYFWQKYYSQVFDLVFFDQISEVRQEELKRSGVSLLLLGFDSIIFHDYQLAKIYDITFVGRLHDQNRPKRSALLHKLSNAGFSINIIDGISKSVSQLELAKVYNSSKIVINENLFPSINLRLFEVLASHTLLFTEDSLKELNLYFDDGYDLVTYNSQNVVEKLHYYLDHPQKLAEIAKRGFLKAHKWHSDKCRATYLLGRIKERLLEKLPLQRSNQMVLAVIWSYLKWPQSTFTPIHLKILENHYGKDQNSVVKNQLVKMMIAFLGQDFTSIKSWLLNLSLNNITDWQDLKVIFWLAIAVGDREAVNRILVDKFRLHNLENLSIEDFYFIWAEKLYMFDDLIKPGLTTMVAEPFCSAFDFYQKSSQYPKYQELALKKMAEILISISAIDFAFQISERLIAINPHNSEYLDLYNYCRKLVY